MAFGTVTRRGNPWTDLLALQQEMNRLFESSMGERQGSAGLLASDYLPAVDVLRNEDHIIVRADVPGVGKDNLELTVLNNRLFIRGEKKHNQESNEANAHRLERFYGSFERVIDLPAPVNPEDIKARFEDGVLEITAPISEEAKPRRIAVDVQ
jgi:HSP20 family protein